MPRSDDNLSRNRLAARAVSEWVLIAISVALFSYAFYSISRTQLSPQEANLFAIVLTLASILASWLVSKIYSRHSIDSSIRDNNVQVGNSVSSLKRQIRSLSQWVSGKRLREAGRDNIEIDAWLDHIEQTLSSIDYQIATTLQGIGSIIGDSDRQHGELISQIQALVQEKQETERALDSALSPRLYSEYESKLNDLEERISEYTDKLATPDPTHLAQREEQVDVTCPYCRNVQGAAIVNRVGETRYITCRGCLKSYNLHVAREGFFTRASGYKSSTGSADSSALPVTKGFSLFSPPGFDYSSSEYQALSERVVRLLANAEAPPLSPISIIESIDSSREFGLSKTRIGKFIQLLFWGRLFAFDGQVSYSSNIAKPVSAMEVAVAFCRAIGQRMSTFVSVLEEGAVEQEVKTYFADITSAAEFSQLVEAYRAGHEQGVGGPAYL